MTADEITTPGPPITIGEPQHRLRQGIQTKITLTGSGFVTGAKVFVSGTQVGGAHGAIGVSSTQLSFTLTPSASRGAGTPETSPSSNPVRPIRGEHVHGLSEHHSLTDLRRIREASVRAKHLSDRVFSNTCPAWIIPHDVTNQWQRPSPLLFRRSDGPQPS